MVEVIRLYLSRVLAEATTLHGVFLDVLEMGVLITGASAIGKSELALELISRGNGLVADDIVGDLPHFARHARGTLSGRAARFPRGARHRHPQYPDHLRRDRGASAQAAEIHGAPARITATRRSRISTGCRSQATYQEILGVPIRKVTIPVAAGRNLAVLVEAAVRNFVLNQRGIDSTKEFIERQQRLMEDGG